jgi:hypothetical protein
MIGLAVLNLSAFVYLKCLGGPGPLLDPRFPPPLQAARSSKTCSRAAVWAAVAVAAEREV